MVYQEGICCNRSPQFRCTACGQTFCSTWHVEHPPKEIVHECDGEVVKIED